MTDNARRGRNFEYLCVDEFLRDFACAGALATALELDVIDRLEGGPCGLAELAADSKIDDRGLELLVGMLSANGVIEPVDGKFRLTARFATALQYRDLLQAKLDFAKIVMPDFLESFTVLLAEPDRFFATSRVAELFAYHRCFDPTPENRAHTSRWMRITTVLTKYESQVCMERHDFSRHGRMLDVGGNSGEFALQVCRRHPAMQVTVYDLPLVCEIGEQHIAAEPESGRIRFVKAKLASEPLPPGHDIVSFKSMLHDWPEGRVQQFLGRAYRALAPGGTVLIFERATDAGRRNVPYSLIPLLLFFRSYRSSGDYVRYLETAGFRDIRVDAVELDMPFLLVSATK